MEGDNKHVSLRTTLRDKQVFCTTRRARWRERTILQILMEMVNVTFMVQGAQHHA